jgi:hypothetical protein
MLFPRVRSCERVGPRSGGTLAKASPPSLHAVMEVQQKNRAPNPSSAPTQIVTSLLHCVFTSLSALRPHAETQPPRFIKLRRRIHIQRIRRNTLPLPFRRHIPQRSVIPRIRHRENHAAITHHKNIRRWIGRRLRRRLRCWHMRRHRLLPRAIRLPLRIFKLRLQIRIALVRRSLLRFFNCLRILNVNFRSRNQKSAKSKRHRLPESEIPPQLPVLRAHRSQVRIVESKPRHIIRNEIGRSEIRIQADDSIRRGIANMPRRRMRGNHRMADRMRRNRRAHMRRNRRAHMRRSHRRRYCPCMNSCAAADSTSMLREHCQRQPQHRNRDYPNSSHSSTMPLPSPAEH